MRLVQLEYFIKIAECGSITKAAQELYVSQPSLTKAIAVWRLNLISNFWNGHPRVCG